jgi:hypothetical protein
MERASLPITQAKENSMRLAPAIIFYALCCMLTAASGQQSAHQQRAPKVSIMQSAGADSNQSNAELRTDVERMRVIVQQMEENLAFVDTTQSPLKHQFELEIRMWKMVIARMERTLNGSKAH